MSDDDAFDAKADTAIDAAIRPRVVGARFELDVFAREVMRANAAAALFGKTATVTIGRYQLAREVGTGGGGIVFLATDPELGRPVAVKLIDAADPAVRAKAVAEGKALAKVSNPHVVQVHDVGVVDDRVYLVMELVKGESLRAYAEHASVRDVIRAYRQAGDGLVAAHDAGLVHRDFKPDNAMRGADGRVRVVDFGLAGAEGDPAEGGTPRYMAPEQTRGAPVTAAVDQYAFAASLREAVARAAGGTPPRWLDSIAERATAPDPAARFPSMAVLLREVANDPAARWRRRAAVAIPLAIGAIGFAVGYAGDDTKPCDDGTAAIAPAWTPARGAAAADHVAGLGTAFATSSAPRVRTVIDDYAGDWKKGHHAACIAARTEPSATVIDRRTACLASARNQLGAVIDVLGVVDAKGLGDGLRAVSELPDLTRCADAEALVNDIPPPTPDQLARAREINAALDRASVLADAARPDAVEATAAAVTAARGLGYQPLVAQALLLQGRALEGSGQRTQALEPLTEAVDIAIPVRDDATAVEAYARAIRAHGADDYASAIAGIRPILGLAARLGNRDRFATALLHNNAGVVELALGHVDKAREELVTAVELARGLTGPGAVELAWARTNLSLMLADGAERERVSGEAAAVARDRLGPDHPLALRLSILAAFGMAGRTASRSALRESCSRLAELHPEHNRNVVECGYELAMLDLADGDRAAARTSLGITLAARTDGADTDLVDAARGFAALLDGDSKRARAELERVRERRAPKDDTPWYMLLLPADVEVGLAELDGTTGERARLERALGYLERAAAVSAVIAVQRRLQWVNSRLKR